MILSSADLTSKLSRRFFSHLSLRLGRLSLIPAGYKHMQSVEAALLSIKTTYLEGFMTFHPSTFHPRIFNLNIPPQDI